MDKFLNFIEDIKNFPCLVRRELMFPEPTLLFWEPLWKEVYGASFLKKLMGFPEVPTWLSQVQRKGPCGQSGGISTLLN